MTGSHAVPPDRRLWAGFVKAFALTAFAAMALLYAFVIGLDPYGTRTGPTHPPTPIMDLNQRYMYPQLARSGLFDAALFGTSTVRLLDPARLSTLFGAHFANLGMNAGTPWEQSELARLYLRHNPAPKMLIFGLDRNWCEPDADQPARRVTFRAFPPWLYNEDPLDDYPDQLNMRSVEIAGRVALHRLGLMRERIRGDGYEVFTPPEARYDLAQARARIWGQDPAPLPPSTRPGDAFPALAWLDQLLGLVPHATRVVLLMPPIHVAAQAAIGSSEAATDEACKSEIVRAAHRHGAATLDFRYPSPLTRDDAHYWDKLHYRLPIAAQLADALKSATESGRDAADGSYRVLSWFGS